jgi:hypothetical protein
MMGIPAPLHKGVAGMADRRRTADALSREGIARAKPPLREGIVSATPTECYGPDKIGSRQDKDCEAEAKAEIA